MASFVAKIISKKILGETLQNNFGKEDPYFETVPATRLDGTPSTKKTKKRRKALPAGISEHDGKVLTKVKRRAYRLDMSLFTFLGVRFGWSSVIGIIPGVGDVLDAFMAMMVFRTCQQVEGGLPGDVKTKMMLNIIVDFGIGLIPFLGDIADAVFRANTKNAIVLEKYLREKGAKSLKAQGHAPPAVDPTDPDEFDRWEEREDHPPQYTSGGPSRHQSRSNGHGQSSRPQREEPLPAAPSERSGWFSGFGSKKRQYDVERGGDSRQAGDAPLPRIPNEEPHRPKATLQKSRP